MSKYKNKQSKTMLRKKETKRDNSIYFLLIGLVVVSVIYKHYFKIDTIGQDYRYFLYIFLIPTTFGITLFGYFRRSFLRNKLNETKQIFSKVLLISSYLIQGFIISYLSFGFLANAVWDYSNKITADSNLTETINCQILKIHTGTTRTSPRISFIFKGKNEYLTIDSKTYGQYFDSKPSNLKIQLEIRKGNWNYYIVDDWEIKNYR